MGVTEGIHFQPVNPSLSEPRVSKSQDEVSATGTIFEKAIESLVSDKDEAPSSTQFNKATLNPHDLSGQKTKQSSHQILHFSPQQAKRELGSLQEGQTSKQVQLEILKQKIAQLKGYVGPNISPDVSKILEDQTKNIVAELKTLTKDKEWEDAFFEFDQNRTSSKSTEKWEGQLDHLGNLTDTFSTSKLPYVTNATDIANGKIVYKIKSSHKELSEQEHQWCRKTAARISFLNQGDISDKALHHNYENLKSYLYHELSHLNPKAKDHLIRDLNEYSQQTVKEKPMVDQLFLESIYEMSHLPFDEQVKYKKEMHTELDHYHHILDRNELLTEWQKQYVSPARVMFQDSHMRKKENALLNESSYSLDQLKDLNPDIKLDKKISILEEACSNLDEIDQKLQLFDKIEHAKHPKKGSEFEKLSKDEQNYAKYVESNSKHIKNHSIELTKLRKELAEQIEKQCSILKEEEFNELAENPVLLRALGDIMNNKLTNMEAYLQKFGSPVTIQRKIKAIHQMLIKLSKDQGLNFNF